MKYNNLFNLFNLLLFIQPSISNEEIFVVRSVKVLCHQWQCVTKLIKINRKESAVYSNVTFTTPLLHDEPILRLAFFIKHGPIYHHEPELTYNLSLCHALSTDKVFAPVLQNCSNLPRFCPPEGIPAGLHVHFERCLFYEVGVKLRQYAFKDEFRTQGDFVSRNDTLYMRYIFDAYFKKENIRKG